MTSPCVLLIYRRSIVKEQIDVRSRRVKSGTIQRPRVHWLSKVEATTRFKFLSCHPSDVAQIDCRILAGEYYRLGWLRARECRDETQYDWEYRSGESEHVMTPIEKNDEVT